MNFEHQEKTNEQILAEAEALILDTDGHNHHEFWETADESSLYSFEAESGEKKVFFFGAHHENDPENPMFDQIRETFQKQSPDLVLVEGYPEINSAKEEIAETYPDTSEEKLIRSDDERGLALKLAVDSEIDFDSPEPTREAEVDYIFSQEHTVKDILSYYTLRGLDRYPKMSLDELLEKRKYVKRAYRPSNISEAEMVKLYEEIIKENHPIDPDYIRSIQSPMKTEGQENSINKVAKDVSLFRNKTILKKLQESLKTHENVLIVYGNSHALVLEKAIEKIVKG